VGEVSNPYKLLVLPTEGKKRTWRRRRRLEDNIKPDLKVIMSVWTGFPPLDINVAEDSPYML